MEVSNRYISTEVFQNFSSVCLQESDHIYIYIYIYIYDFVELLCTRSKACYYIMAYLGGHHG